jgi:molecular chaperone DnaK
VEIGLGIDFGTSATKAALMMGGRVALVVDDARAHISSAVYVPAQGGLEVISTGDRRGLDPSRTVTSAKRLLGRVYSDPRVREMDAAVGYKIVRSHEGWAHVEIDGHEIAPVQVVAAVLRRARLLAERIAGRRIETAVLSTPVRTCSGYGPALVRAAELAGLTSVRLVYEPVAALWGSGIPSGDPSRRVLVSDFGAGTFDCALLAMHPRKIDVLGCSGDEYLGGDDFDLALADAIAGQVFRTSRADLRRELSAWAETVRLCEAAKRRLSSAAETDIQLPSAYVKDGKAHDVELRLVRPTVEGIWRPLVERALAAAGETLVAARSPAALIDDLVLVGGSNLIPSVRSAFIKKIGRQPTAVAASDVVIAVGLARLAAHAANPAARAAG